MTEVATATRPLDDRSATATRLWIAVGAGWFTFCVTVWGLWITGPDFKANHIGADQATPAYVALVRGVEIFTSVLAIAILWIFVFRPWLRTRRLSFDGLFFLSCWMLLIQEPWINYNSHQFLYTTVDYNRGSWCRYIPGWNSQNAQLMPVGGLIWSTTYLSLAALWAYAGSRLMGWLRARWPRLRPWQLAALAFVAFIPADIILETGAGYLQLYTYASTVPWLTMNAGKIYQLPVYEVFNWCATLTCLSSIHFFRNERGEALPERHILDMKLGRRTQTLFRFFAILGCCQTAFIVCYNAPYFYWSTKGGAYPPYASYQIAGVCGPGTHYDCPSLTTPLPKAGSPTNRGAPSRN